MADYSFKPSWWASVLFVAGFVLFNALAVWQLGRAEEKRHLIELRQQHEQEPPIHLTAASTMDLQTTRYRPVMLEGEYDVEHQFLVDNQVHDQLPGYHVLTPLRLDDGSAVLVNRGWIPLGRDRRELPKIELSRSHVRVIGSIDLLHRVGFRLKNAEIPGSGWPSLLQVPDATQISGRLGYPVSPYQVLLSPAAEEGYLRDWREAKLDPGKNQGYALQWFLFAVVALIFYVRHALSRRTPHSS